MIATVPRLHYSSVINDRTKLFSVLTFLSALPPHNLYEKLRIGQIRARTHARTRAHTNARVHVFSRVLVVSSAFPIERNINRRNA